MEPKTVAALLTLGVLVLCDMTSVVMAHDYDGDLTALDNIDTAADFFEAATILTQKFRDAKTKQQEQTYTPEKLKGYENNLANSKPSDDFKIDANTNSNSKEGRNIAENNRLHFEEEFLKRKHTARAEASAQRRDKRQEIGGGSNCFIPNQNFMSRTFTNRSFKNCVFTNCNFINCTFTNCTFADSTFTNCNFINCTFTNCSFTDSTLTNCNFPGCTFIDSSFRNCALTNCNFSNTSFKNTPLTNCTYTNVNFNPRFNYN